MFARVSIYDIPPDQRAEARASFESAIARIRETEGLTKAHFLLGSESDRAVTITFWETREAMAASRVAASRLRSEAVASVGGDVVSVEEFEVVPED
jgi:heme-degrading monooxygenase HmoA